MTASFFASLAIRRAPPRTDALTLYNARISLTVALCAAFRDEESEPHAAALRPAGELDWLLFDYFSRIVWEKSARATNRRKAHLAKTLIVTKHLKTLVKSGVFPLSKVVVGDGFEPSKA